MSPGDNPVPSTGAGWKKRLSQEVVLSAALALVDAEGLDALTMRRLGQELGRDIPNELQQFIADENESVPRRGLHRIPPHDFPRLHALAPVLADYGGEAELDEGISILLSGIAAACPHR